MLPRPSGDCPLLNSPMLLKCCAVFIPTLLALILLKCLSKVKNKTTFDVREASSVKTNKNSRSKALSCFSLGSAWLHAHLCICLHRWASLILLPVLHVCLYCLFPPCSLWSAQRSVTLNRLAGQTRHEPETPKLKNSKVPPHQHLLNPLGARALRPGTKMVRLLLKRPLKLQARLAHPSRRKLTRGILTLLAEGMVSSAGCWRNLLTNGCPPLPACLPPCMRNTCLSVFLENMDFFEASWTC